MSRTKWMAVGLRSPFLPRGSHALGSAYATTASEKQRAAKPRPANPRREKQYGLCQKLTQFCNEGQLARAESLFHRMLHEQRIVVPNLPIYHTMMTAYKEKGQVRDVARLFRDLKQRQGCRPELKPTAMTYLLLLDAHVTAADQAMDRETRHRRRVLDQDSSAAADGERGIKVTADELPELKHYLGRVWHILIEYDTKCKQAWSTPLLNVTIKAVGRLGHLALLLELFPPVRGLAQTGHTMAADKDAKPTPAVSPANKLFYSTRELFPDDDSEPSASLGDPELHNTYIDADAKLDAIFAALRALQPDTISFQSALEAAQRLGAPLAILEAYLSRAIKEDCLDTGLVNTLLLAYKDHALAHRLSLTERVVLLDKSIGLLWLAKKGARFGWSTAREMESLHDVATMPREPLAGSRSRPVKRIEDDISSHFLPLERHFPIDATATRRKSEKAYRLEPNEYTHGLLMMLFRISDAFRLGIEYYETCVAATAGTQGEGREKWNACHYMAISCHCLSGDLKRGYDLAASLDLLAHPRVAQMLQKTARRLPKLDMPAKLAGKL